ncbi:MAG: FmdB family zinc ribbon protein [Bordetella sp.]
MPIYAYACSACGHRQDILQKLSDAPLSECPQCHEASFSKQLTAPGFVLKGSGWYVTDFRDNGSKKSPEKSPGETPAKSAESSSSAEVTPNSKSSPTETGSGTQASTTAAAEPKAASPVTSTTSAGTSAAT